MGQNVQTASSTPLGSTNREKPALCGLFHFPQCLCGFAGISRGLPVPCGIPQPCRFFHHATMQRKKRPCAAQLVCAGAFIACNQGSEALIDKGALSGKKRKNSQQHQGIPEDAQHHPVRTLLLPVDPLFQERSH